MEFFSVDPSFDLDLEINQNKILTGFKIDFSDSEDEMPSISFPPIPEFNLEMIDLETEKLNSYYVSEVPDVSENIMDD